MPSFLGLSLLVACVFAATCNLGGVASMNGGFAIAAWLEGNAVARSVNVGQSGLGAVQPIDWVVVGTDRVFILFDVVGAANYVWEYVYYSNNGTLAQTSNKFDVTDGASTSTLDLTPDDPPRLVVFNQVTVSVYSLTGVLSSQPLISASYFQTLGGSLQYVAVGADSTSYLFGVGTRVQRFNLDGSRKTPDYTNPAWVEGDIVNNVRGLVTSGTDLVYILTMSEIWTYSAANPTGTRWKSMTSRPISIAGTPNYATLFVQVAGTVFAYATSTGAELGTFTSFGTNPLRSLPCSFATLDNYVPPPPPPPRVETAPYVGEASTPIRTAFQCLPGFYYLNSTTGLWTLCPGGPPPPPPLPSIIYTPGSNGFIPRGIPAPIPDPCANPWDAPAYCATRTNTANNGGSTTGPNSGTNPNTNGGDDTSAPSNSRDSGSWLEVSLAVVALAF